MIFDTLDNFPRYLCVHPLFTYVFEFLDNRPLQEFEPGNIDIYRGIYASVSTYETKKSCDAKIECHRSSIDIQMVLSGEERIGVCSRKQCSVVHEYNTEKDIEFLTGVPDFIRLTKSNFAVFFPQDAHMPGIRLDDSRADFVKKIVFKIPT